jgi:hypothetical protein
LVLAVRGRTLLFLPQQPYDSIRGAAQQKIRQNRQSERGNKHISPKIQVMGHHLINGFEAPLTRIRSAGETVSALPELVVAKSRYCLLTETRVRE